MVDKRKLGKALLAYLPHVPAERINTVLAAVPGSAGIEEGIALFSVLVGLTMREHPASIVDPIDTYRARRRPPRAG